MCVVIAVLSFRLVSCIVRSILDDVLVGDREID
jgi:hypothetical protein